MLLRVSLKLLKIIGGNALCRICTYKNEAKCGPLEPSTKKEEVVIEVKECDPEACQLPFCYCTRNGDSPPLEVRNPQNLPQMVMLMFDGAVNLNNFPLYDALLKGYSLSTWFEKRQNVLTTHWGRIICIGDALGT